MHVGAPGACPSCDADVPRRARFCGRCGATLTRASARPTASRAADAARRASRRPTLVAAVALVVTAAALAGSGVAGPRAGSDTASEGEVLRPTADDDPAEGGGPSTPTDEATGDASASDEACTVGRTGRACVRWSQGLVGDDWAAAATRDTIVVTGATGSVRTYDTRTGVTRWRAQLDGPAVLRATSASSIVVTVGDRTLLLDPRDGAELASAARVRRAVATDDGLTALVDGDVVAFDTDGTERWRVPIPGRSLAWVTSAGATLSSPLSVLADQLTSLDPADGSERWTVPTTGRIAGVHAVGDQLLVAVEDTGRGASVLLIRDDGEVVGDHQVRGRVAWVTAAEDGSAVVVLERSSGAGVLVVEPDRGLARPITELGDGVGDSWAVTAGAGVVAVGVARPDPEVVVLGRRDGLIRLRVPLEAPGRALALPGDATVVAALDGMLAAWSLGSGGVRWQVGTDGAAEVLQQQPLIVSDRTTLRALEPDPARRTYRPLSPRTSGDRREASGGVVRDVIGTRRSQAS